MNRFGIGQSVQRVEDKRFLTGSGCYVDDIDLAHQAWGAVLTSPLPHARIRSISTAAARAAPGVLCVLTGADIQAEGLGGIGPLFMPEDMGGPKGYRTFRTLLSHDKVRYVGDYVAFVVAETSEQAQEALPLIEVDYEELPFVTDSEQAIAPDAPKVWDEWTSNMAFPLMLGNKDATDAAFASAAHVVSLRLENNRISANSMETRGCIGAYERGDDSYTLYTSTQGPHAIRTILAQAVFHLPETQFRVVARDVGGGFGMKGGAYPEEGLVLLASRRLGRPVKWIATRSESLLTDNHGRDQVVRGEMALDASGHILAIRAQALHGLGAYVSGAAVVPVLYSLKLIPNVYAVPAVHVATRAIFTHTVPTTPYRGAGRPEAVYLTERLMDAAAAKLGVDPIALRRLNYIRPAAMPYATGTGLTYDSGEFDRLTNRCIELADWAGYAARQSASAARGRVRGRAFTYYIEDCGVFNDRMELRFDPGGTLTIVAGTFSHGQGHATTFAQLAAQYLGVPFETIRYLQGDTSQVPFGRGTYASRSSMIGGSAIKLAAEALIEKARPLAAHMMETAAADVSFAEGNFTIAGTDRKVSMVDVAKMFYRPVGLPRQFGIGLEAAASFAGDPPNFPNGAHCCELEVDPDTGEVFIDRYAVVDDVGVVINPMVCEGQIEGGLAQGFGQALHERVVYDPQSGQLVTGSFTDYTMPRSDDMPQHMAADFIEIPCLTNPVGVKGVGEAGCVAAPPTIINAIIDALRPMGVSHIDMPATPQRVWQAIHQAAA